MMQPTRDLPAGVGPDRAIRARLVAPRPIDVRSRGQSCVRVRDQGRESEGSTDRGSPAASRRLTDGSTCHSYSHRRSTGGKVTRIVKKLTCSGAFRTSRSRHAEIIHTKVEVARAP